MFVPLQETQIQQGTEPWFQRRKHKMTGSKPSSIMFECKDEKSYLNLWDIVFGNKKPEPFNQEQQKAVDWGSTMEDVACKQFYTTLPNTTVYETSIIDHPVYDWIAASPDGYVERNINGVIEKAALEIKCPNSKLRDSAGNPEPFKMARELKKKKHPPYYYMTQVHFEMVALNAPHTYFYMWTPWASKLWKIQFDHAYWKQTMNVLAAFKHKNIPWAVLHAKIKEWIMASKAIAKQYHTIEEWEHRPNMITIHPWYNQFEKKWVKKIHE